MRIDKINIINTNSENSKINFKKMQIVKPEIWPLEVLDVFVKNKDIQQLTKDWAKDNENLIAFCIGGLEKYILTISKGLKLMYTLESNTLEGMQSIVHEFRQNDFNSLQMSKEKKEKLDSIKSYIDEFNKSL